jgi:radical SAM protein with 4Fe4S-binding SPASM domain
MLTAEIAGKAARLRVPLGVHLDLTARCNEDCAHCYVDHSGGEMSAAEIGAVLEQLAAAGTLFLTLSGGEPLLRRDFFDIVARARKLKFSIRVKTNGTLIGEREVRRLRELLVSRVDVSVYSARPEVHDAITRLPGSLERTLAALGRLAAAGVPIAVTHILTALDRGGHNEVAALARGLGAACFFDALVTPRFNGDRSVLDLNLTGPDLVALFGQPGFVEAKAEDCAPDEIPCSAAHSLCYISAAGEVYPCVQFPLPAGNVRRRPFAEIWNGEAFEQVRRLRVRDLPQCRECSLLLVCHRCPGLAYMDGDMAGPSRLDCAHAQARAAASASG